MKEKIATTAAPRMSRPRLQIFPLACAQQSERMSFEAGVVGASPQKPPTIPLHY